MRRTPSLELTVRSAQPLANSGLASGQSGDRMPVIANAAEQRSPDGEVLSTRLVILRAVDRRRSERELVDARASATESLKSERETAELREQFIAVSGSRPPQPPGGDQRGRQDPAALGRAGRTERTSRPRHDQHHGHPHVDFARGRLGGAPERGGASYLVNKNI